MKELYRLEPLVLAGSHGITRAVVEVEDDCGGIEVVGRVRCVACRRTQLIPLPVHCTVVGVDFLTDAGARTLHSCGCGGRGVSLTDE
jgi:hypothetical protein